MSKVVLFDPSFPTSDEENSKFNAGLLSIASYLKHHGVNARVYYKTQTYEGRLETLISPEVKLVGISAMTAQYPAAMELARKVRRVRPDLKIIIGGYHARLFPEKVLSRGDFDIACLGDGEQVTLEVFQMLNEGGSLDNVQGIAYRDGDRTVNSGEGVVTNLETLPHMDYSLIEGLEPVRWHDGQKSMYVYSGNQCPYRCTFCINSVVKAKFRQRKIGDVVDEIQTLLNEYDVTHIYPIDELFCGSKKRFFEFLDLIEKRNLKFNWFVQNRADTIKESYLNPKALKRVRRLGCNMMLIGVESGSDEMIKRMNKKMKVKQVVSAVKNLVEADIMPVTTFMIGMPGEKKDDYLATLRLVHELYKAVDYKYRIMLSGPSIFRPIPGSIMYEQAMSFYPEERRPDFFDLSTFVSSDPALPNSLQLKYCDYPWINDKEVAYDVITCIERFSVPGRIGIKFKNYIKSVVAGYCPTLILKTFPAGRRHLAKYKGKKPQGVKIFSFPVYLLSFALYFIPAYRRYLLRTKRNPDYFNPFLWFKWRSLLRRTSHINYTPPDSAGSGIKLSLAQRNKS